MNVSHTQWHHWQNESLYHTPSSGSTWPTLTFLYSGLLSIYNVTAPEPRIYVCLPSLRDRDGPPHTRTLSGVVARAHGPNTHANTHTHTHTQTHTHTHTHTRAFASVVNEMRASKSRQAARPGSRLGRRGRRDTPSAAVLRPFERRGSPCRYLPGSLPA